MEISWVISAVVAMCTGIGTIFVMKYMVAELKKDVGVIFTRLETHGDDIVALNTKSELAVTAKDVDDKFVSKELFRQFEKHMDSRFDGIEQGQKRILEYMQQNK
jgi:galactitol-specific phosphotransferase system IIB component